MNTNQNMSFFIEMVFYKIISIIYYYTILLYANGIAKEIIESQTISRLRDFKICECYYHYSIITTNNK